jgi:hypothetical protein
MSEQGYKFSTQVLWPQKLGKGGEYMCIVITHSVWLAGILYRVSKLSLEDYNFFLFENADISTYGRGQAVKTRQGIREQFPHPPTIILTSRWMIQFRDKIETNVRRTADTHSFYTELSRN